MSDPDTGSSTGPSPSEAERLRHDQPESHDVWLDSADSQPARQPTRSIRRAALLRSREGRSRRLVAAIPLGVFVGVLVVFAAFSHVLREQEIERVRIRTELTADEVRHRLEQYVDLRLAMLEQLSDDLASGHVRDEESFRAHARDSRRYVAGIASVNWIDDTGIIRWLEPEVENLPAKGRDLDDNPIAGPVLAAARSSGRLQMTPPLDLYQGGHGFAVYAPILVDGEVIGFVNGAFRYGPLVRVCLDGNVARSHFLEIADRGEVIHAWKDDSDRDGLPYAVTRQARVANRAWTLTLRPTSTQIAAAETLADEIALALGVLAAFGLAGLAYRVARGRALLRTSRERYRNVVDDTPAMICRYLPDGTITFVNIAYSRAVGRQPRQVIGTSYFDILPEHTRADVRAALYELNSESPSRVHELEIEHSATERSWQQWMDRALFDQSGAIVEFQSVGLDITAMRRAQDDLERSEERFRTIFNSVADGILLFDPDGGLGDVNDRTCALFGLSREELIGRGVDALTAAGATDLSSWLEHAATHGRFAVPDWNVRSTDGTAWEAELELQRTTIAGVPRIVAVVRDVTARAQLAEQLRQSQKMEAMGTLAGGIAHDFNNILTAIMGHAELARMTIDASSSEARSLEGIVAACEQATGVTRSLLTFSRRGDVPRSTVDIATLLRDTLRLLRPLLPGAVEITSEITTTEALWVDADTSQVQQVIMNLTLNARDAMPNGGRLHVALGCESSYDSARATRDWAEDVVITVSDTGVGMSDEVRRRVVEPFFTTKTRERGTGLGMSVVHGIVSSHGGTLEIESKEGIGTTVRVSLPRRDEPVALPPEAPRVETPVEATGARVLLVEDNAQVRRLLAGVLATRSCRVAEESNGELAYNSYVDHRGTWDLVVLDIDLPGMTGTDVLRRIRDSGDNVPALLVSGNPEFAPNADEHGNTRFLQKPFTMREFGAAAAEMMSAAVDSVDAG